MRRANRRVFLRLLGLGAAGVLLAGCGQKGPLFFREDLERAVEAKLDREDRDDSKGASAPKP